MVAAQGTPDGPSVPQRWGRFAILREGGLLLFGLDIRRQRTRARPRTQFINLQIKIGSFLD